VLPKSGIAQHLCVDIIGGYRKTPRNFLIGCCPRPLEIPEVRKFAILPLEQLKAAVSGGLKNEKRHANPIFSQGA